jgi:hypothetical protein
MRSPVVVLVTSNSLIVIFFVMLLNIIKLALLGIIASKNIISSPLGEITSGNYKM